LGIASNPALLPESIHSFPARKGSCSAWNRPSVPTDKAATASIAADAHFHQPWRVRRVSRASMRLAVRIAATARRMASTSSVS
jgi:hypothetical protein